MRVSRGPHISWSLGRRIAFVILTRVWLSWGSRIGQWGQSFFKSSISNKCFAHPIFRFWFLFPLGDEVTKIWKYYVIFVYILQDKMSMMEINEKKITKLKWPQYQKSRDKNMEWTKRKPTTLKISFEKTVACYYDAVTWKRHDFAKKCQMLLMILEICQNSNVAVL